MEKVTLNIADQRMLELLDYLKSGGDIRFRQQFLDTIGMPKQFYRRVIMGKQHFSPEQIARACEAYNENANWVLGIKGAEKYNGTKRKPAKALKPV